MSTTDLTTTTPGTTTLTIVDGQDRFTDVQVAALRQLGVANASQGDLDVFFHVAKRAGLDPFAKQVYMIGRPSRENVDGQWVTTIKQTIQTGIDGYRLIARRAADRARIRYHVSAPTFYDFEGNPHPIWIAAFGTYPAACAITVTRDGEDFPAVAMFAEYVQTQGTGDNRQPTQMWRTRPAGQLAKCAEALALRMAFPHDLSGIHVDAELDTMEDRPNRVVEPGTGAPVTGPDRLRGRMRPVTVEDVAGEEGAAQVDAHIAKTVHTDDEAADDVSDAAVLATEEQIAAIGAGFKALGLRTGKAKVAYVEKVLGIGDGNVPTPQEMTETQAAEVVASMAFDQQAGHDEEGTEG